MKKLFIIGNGFDLAHNLKTRYSDFLLWYINKVIRQIGQFQYAKFESDLIIVDGHGRIVREFESLADIDERTKHLPPVTIEGKTNFMNELLSMYAQSNWVDIEYLYYQTVLKIYRPYERNHNINKAEVSKLNDCFDKIKCELSEYLLTVKPIAEIDYTILSNFKIEMRSVAPEDTMILVFNYTGTIEKYRVQLGISSDNVIYIHGKLNDRENPIIFGYGDEMDGNYGKLEDLNYNEILRNMKSFSYFKTINYRRLSGFINTGIYNTVIMGHSCGISDRVLLNNIFCNSKCQSIKIYYHKRGDNSNDHFEKTQEISRHFKADDKSRMRDLIIPFPQSGALS